MAGFDPATQRHAKTVGMCMDGGNFDFSAGSATIDVPTNLVRAMCGFAIADLTATTSTQQTLFAYKVGDVSNCKVTFIRAGGEIDNDAHMSYWLMGY